MERRFSKYNNKKVAGYDSIKEYQRSLQLKLLQKQGLISDLQEQVTYKLEVNGYLICKYICDYQYRENGNLIIEDVKSDFTKKLRIFSIKRKLMKAIHNIDIRVV